jgi:hypothetical protein
MRAIMGRIDALSALVLTLALFTQGCGSDQEDRSAREGDSRKIQEGRSARGGEALKAVSSSAPGTQPPGLPALPDAGAIFVEVTERGVTALANAASRIEVLQRLEGAVGFQLVLRKSGEDRPISVRVADSALEAVLAQVLTGVPYQLRYEVDEAQGGHSLAVVGVGSVRSGLASAEEREQRRLESRQRGRDAIARRRQQQDEEDRRVEALSPEERERLRQEAMEARREHEAQVTRDLESPDSWVRADAARQIEAEGDGITRLSQILADDPNAEVRAAAASQLSDSDSAGSINSLLTALNDPSTIVILEALDSLLFAGNETIIPSIEPLLDHPEEIVREAAGDTIDFLE